MSALTDRFRGRRGAAPTGAAPSATPTAAHAELRARRDALAEEVAELTWDLGGLTYEMAIRDHFRLDVLIRRAASPAGGRRRARRGRAPAGRRRRGRRRRVQVLRRPPQPRRRLLLEVRPTAHAAGGERDAYRAARQRHGALGLRHAPATNERRFCPYGEQSSSFDGERRFPDVWRLEIVARGAGAPRTRRRSPSLGAQRSSNTSVSVLPLPLRRMVPAAPTYAPVPPVIA